MNRSGDFTPLAGKKTYGRITGLNQVPTQQQLAIATLEDGQIWIWNGQQLEVKHVGKYLVEIMITRTVQMPVQRYRRVAKQLESIKTVVKFLHDHRAVLGQ